MQQDNKSDQVMVVVLNDMVNHSLPRILAVRAKVRGGAVLSATELDFFLSLLNRLTHCYHVYAHDRQCLSIFSCIAHMLYKVINRAHENEQKTLKKR